MQEARFRVWLERGRSAGTVNSRISNCRRVERYEGDLDARYDADGLAGLTDRLNPSDQRQLFLPVAEDGIGRFMGDGGSV